MSILTSTQSPGILHKIDNYIQTTCNKNQSLLNVKQKSSSWGDKHFWIAWTVVANRLTTIKKEKEKPSFLITVLCLLLAFVVPYSVITYFNRDTPRQSIHIERHNLDLPTSNSEQAEETSKPIENNIKYVITKPGDSLTILFAKMGISSKTLHEILDNNPHRQRLKSIKPNQKIEFQFGKNNQLEKLIIPITSSQKLTIAKVNDNFVSKIQTIKLQSHLHYVTATVSGSLYQTGKQLKIPYKLLKQMTNIFNWQIDFARDIRDGDQFTLIYKAYYSNDQLVGLGDIIAATFKNKGYEYQAIRYASDGKKYEYYDANGVNLRKAFDRWPVRFSHISSPFNLSRNHPILGVVRPHKGIDLAARLGTPIKATGDGKISKIGKYGGYGNLIEIKHRNRYTTRYAHMVKFHKGLSLGSRVKKGQVIGYVGQTGLADGPHCHYEFHVNNKPKNPATVVLPQAHSVPKSKIAEFRAKSGTLLAQLKLYQDAKIASNETSSKMVT